jgi:RNA polymerase sigma factor (sigma-70 family)
VDETLFADRLAAALAGDLKAREELLALLYQHLTSRAARQVRLTAGCGSHCAEDVVQEVLLAVVHSLHTFRGSSGGEFRKWGTVILRGRSVDHARKGRCARLRQADDISRHEVQAGETNGGGELGDEDAAAVVQIRDVLNQLPREQREAFELRFLDGLPFKDIASLQGVPLPTAMYRVSCARRRIQLAVGVLLTDDESGAEGETAARGG